MAGIKLWWFKWELGHAKRQLFAIRDSWSYWHPASSTSTEYTDKMKLVRRLERKVEQLAWRNNG